MENKEHPQLRSAEEILVKHRGDYDPNYHIEGMCGYYEITQYKKVIAAMEEYASQFKSVQKEADKQESQEELWKQALHHASSRMDFMQFLTKYFIITRKQ